MIDHLFDNAILKIRIIQARRSFAALGVIYKMIMLLAFLAAIVLIYFINAQSFNYAAAFFVGFILLLFSFHRNRSDAAFATVHLGDVRTAFFTEYFFLSLPFTAPVLFTPHFYFFFLATVVLYGIAQLPFAQKQSPAFKIMLLPDSDFEWRSVLRKNYFLFIAVYCAALVSSYFIIVPLVFLWIISSLIFSAYMICEPYHILIASGKRAKGFLNSKLLSHSIKLTLLLLPPLILNSLFHPDYFFLNAVFIVIQIINLCSVIVLKYGLYTAGETLEVNSLLAGLIQMSAIIPFLLPVPVFVFIRYYFKAMNNLKYNLND